MHTAPLRDLVETVSMAVMPENVVWQELVQNLSLPTCTFMYCCAAVAWMHFMTVSTLGDEAEGRNPTGRS